jgi:hypothetical protein
LAVAVGQPSLPDSHGEERVCSRTGKRHVAKRKQGRAASDPVPTR